MRWITVCALIPIISSVLFPSAERTSLLPPGSKPNDQCALSHSARGWLRSERAELCSQERDSSDPTLVSQRSPPAAGRDSAQTVSIHSSISDIPRWFQVCRSSIPAPAAQAISTGSGAFQRNSTARLAAQAFSTKGTFLVVQETDYFVASAFTLAQRARCAAAILFLAAADITRFLGAAFCVCPALSFSFAHRARCAAAILARPATDICRVPFRFS
jgi:hypothetical protein